MEVGESAVYQEVNITAISTFNGESVECYVILQDVYFLPLGDKGLVESFYHAPLPEGSIVPADGYF